MKTKKLKVLLSKGKIQKRITQLGKQITADYKGKDLVVICVLKGAFMFCADLIRAIDLPLTVEFFGVQSYGDNTHSSGIVKTTLDVDISLEGKDVLIIEDVIDTGLTVDYLLKYFSSRNPRSLKLCTFLLKPECIQQKVDIDYCGFKIGKKFVVGYGLDAAQLYRNLKDLVILT
ncbi:MAG: hypoxanthine phosphoribosyltransferase [Deltaproteobacteria bacterium]|nr:hypoxanthine phosphoribosyltransferase [Deltaproteobacteria bacterium]